MDRSSTHPLPPPRSTIDTMPGQPAAVPAPEPPPARRWSWSLEPDALAAAGGDEWWASLRPLPLDGPADEEAKNATKPTAPVSRPAQAPEPTRPPSDCAAGDLAPNSSAPPPPMVTDLYEQPAPTRRWLMPALVVAAALTAMLGSALSGSAADDSALAAALQQPGDISAVASLPTLDASADLARLGTLTQLEIERASREAEPPPSRLIVSSASPCSQIWLDAHLRGSGQGHTFVVSPGAHAVGCRLPSGQMLVRRAVVAEGRTAAIFFTR